MAVLQSVAMMARGVFKPSHILLTALNQLLKQEPWAAAKLRPYAGKTIRFVSGQLQFSASLTSEGHFAAADAFIEPNVTVTLPPEQRRRAAQLLFSGAAEPRIAEIVDLLYLEGEAGLTRAISDVAQHLNWDQAHFLSERLGPFAASGILSLQRRGREAGKGALRSLAGNLSDFLNYEQQLTVSPVQVQDQAAELEELEHRLRQLEERADRLSNLK